MLRMSKIQRRLSPEQWFEVLLFFLDVNGEPLVDVNGEPLLTEERWQALRVVRSVGSRRKSDVSRLGTGMSLEGPIIGPPVEVAEATGGELPDNFFFVNYTRQGSPDPGQVQPSIHCYAENVAASSNTEKVICPLP